MTQTKICLQPKHEFIPKRKQTLRIESPAESTGVRPQPGRVGMLCNRISSTKLSRRSEPGVLYLDRLQHQSIKGKSNRRSPSWTYSEWNQEAYNWNLLFGCRDFNLRDWVWIRFDWIWCRLVAQSIDWDFDFCIQQFRIMEKYRLVQEHKSEESDEFLGTQTSGGLPEVRITQQGKPRNYISYAMNLFVSLATQRGVYCVCVRRISSHLWVCFFCVFVRLHDFHFRNLDKKQSFWKPWGEPSTKQSLLQKFWSAKCHFINGTICLPSRW